MIEVVLTVCLSVDMDTTPEKIEKFISDCNELASQRDIEWEVTDQEVHD